MEYASLGSSGLEVSRLCLGTMTYGAKQWRAWVLEGAESRPFIRQALEAGINFLEDQSIPSPGDLMSWDSGTALWARAWSLPETHWLTG